MSAAMPNLEITRKSSKPTVLNFSTSHCASMTSPFRILCIAIFSLGMPPNKALANSDSNSSFSSYEAQALWGGGGMPSPSRSDGNKKSRAEEGKARKSVPRSPSPSPTPVCKLQFFVDGGILLPEASYWR